MEKIDIRSGANGRKNTNQRHVQNLVSRAKIQDRHFTILAKSNRGTATIKKYANRNRRRR
ncbi:hypothetical protein HMPREF3213_00531 [Heyndrickxia coagulans]|uniref:Uncharacterized protein n=1 Tax=Heyndrickxia coagulans TaxID=1398 RepID=A0A133L0G9_HEYCO|nr:hypothetical protein HMPREF3213_00531 [Heyndrickxia coagulans]